MPGRGGTIKLFTLFGIRIGVDLSWFLILFLAIFWLSQSFRTVLGSSDTTAFGTAVATALLFFASLVMHELGHAWAARRAGIRVPQIDLWLLGGMARMERDSRTPGEEFKISAAGPAVSLLLAAGCFALGVGLEGYGRFTDAATLRATGDVTPVQLALSFLVTMNLVIFLFNLVPAFPLDGGRIARAIAWRVTGDRGRATRFSGRLGQLFAWLMAAWGLYEVLRGDLGGLWWLLLAFFVGQAARGAVEQTRFAEQIDGVTVADIMDQHPVSVPADLPVIRAEDEFFLRYRWSWFPVVDALGRFVGLAQEERVRGAAKAGDQTVTVGDVMDAEATGDWRVDVEAPLEALLGSESLRRHGALMAVDGDGVLRGVVNVDQVRRALRSAGDPA
ncbi:MAG: site-2 protease family protein [Solirubrobacteraceae bacterium]